MTTAAHITRTVYTEALDGQTIVEVSTTRKIVDGEVKDYVTIVTEADLADCENGEDPQGITFPGRFIDLEAVNKMVGYPFEVYMFEDGEDWSDHWGVRFTNGYRYKDLVLHCRGGEPLS
jgi:hypothetical protein